MNTRRVQSYLKLWGGYQEHAQDLNEYDRQRAAILFHTLAEMPKEDLEFLAQKYVTGNEESKSFLKQVPFSDAELAVKLGITTNACRKKRLVIENRMEEKLSKFVDLVEHREIDEAPFYSLQLGRLYYRDHRGDEVIFTPLSMWAKVFPKGSREGEKIREVFGLEKVVAQQVGYFNKQ